MERDFLGLSSNYKEPLPAIKREISEQETLWPFTQKASSFSQFMSLKMGSGQDRGMNKMPDFATSGHIVAEASTRQRFQGVPMTIPSPVGPVIGFTESWNNSKLVTAPAQMTIFYGGSVSVFDGISPEKAQAIMLLAGNGSFKSSPKAQSHVNLQSVDVSSSKDEQVVTSTITVSEHQRVVASSSGPVSMPTMVPSALPQFRKASLARFLEKRKERVMSTGPYTCEKKQEGMYAAKSNIGSRASSLAL